jgi:hypothetical protein
MANLRQSSSGFPGAFRLEVVVLLLVLVLGLTLAPAALAAGFWNPTGSLHTARWGHTATLLANGKVLVVGGSDGANFVASAEVYDPGTGTWTVFPATGRLYHTATLLGNGKVLVAGGLGANGPLASAEIFDPATGTWTSAGSFIGYYYTATLLDSGKVMMVGGGGKSVQVYDPVTGVWSFTSSLNTGRKDQSTTLLANGLVLVAGGNDFDGNVFSSAELYVKILTAVIWTSTGSLTTPRTAHTATRLLNGKVLLIGGVGAPLGTVLETSELYDPDNHTWTAFPATGRLHHTSTLLANGKVLVAGGSIAGVPPTNAQLYDPVTGAWTSTGSLQTGRMYHTATRLNNGKVLVAGGWNASLGPIVYLSSAELYSSQAANVGTSLLMLLGN